MADTAADLETKWYAARYNVILAISVFLFGVSFAVMCNPPGGYYSDSGYHMVGKQIINHTFGVSVFASTQPRTFEAYMTTSIVAVCGSLIPVAVISSGLPLENRVVVIILFMCQNTTISALVMSLLYRARFSVPGGKKKGIVIASTVVISLWVVMMIIGAIWFIVTVVRADWKKVKKNEEEPQPSG